MRQRGAAWQFALSGLVSVLIIGAIGGLVFRAIARDQALDRAKDVTRLINSTVVEPALGEGLVRGDPAARRHFDRLIRRGVLAHSNIVRVKLWTPDGRIIYSDEPRLIGRRYGLDGEELGAIRHDRVEAEVSELARPENRYERGRGELLEVYMPAHLPNGRPLLFESYRPSASIAGSTRELLWAFIPALAAGLLILWLVNLPLAQRLVRRVRAVQVEREQYLQAAVSASDRERRRIAADLHDGVVQDMNGLSLSLAAEAHAVEDPGGAARLGALAAASRQLTRSVRHALVDIYPPSLHREGLRRALRDLGESVERRGVSVSVEAPERLVIDPAAEALLFRIGQEALRNVVSHAEATTAQISVERHNGSVTMCVTDDGRGFQPSAAGEAPTPEGHLGLRALRALTEDAGGTFAIDSAPGSGTRLRAEVPIA